MNSSEIFLLTTPVVLIMFNRPEHVKKAFEQIKLAKPKELFIIADGPRKNNSDDIVKCNRCKEIVNDINWECNVYKNYAENNLGCGRRPATGLDWVFDHVETAIILEDDCIADQSFFRFCQELLEKYKNNEEIISISGDNFQINYSNNDSYYFSPFPQTCGWATWKRVWKYYDYDIKIWKSVKNKQKLYSNIKNKKMVKKYFSKEFNKIYNKEVTSVWDFQFTFLSFYKSGLNIIPNKNLVRNIGFGDFATHTFNEKSKLSQLMSREGKMEFPLHHPQTIKVDEIAEKFDLKNIYGCDSSIFINLLKRINNFFKMWLLLRS